MALPDKDLLEMGGIWACALCSDPYSGGFGNCHRIISLALDDVASASQSYIAYVGGAMAENYPQKRWNRIDNMCTFLKGCSLLKALDGREVNSESLMQAIEVLNEEAAEHFLGHPMLEWKTVQDPNKKGKRGWTKKVYCEDERLSLRRFGHEIPVLKIPANLPSISLDQMEEILCIAGCLCGFVAMQDDTDFMANHVKGPALKKDFWHWSAVVAEQQPKVLSLLDTVAHRRSRSVH
jgi:hypothetical protein